jgi:hypothetical protein
MTNNPLLQKWEEIHGKKEPPKPQKTIADVVKELGDTSCVPANTPNITTKANHIPSLITYDRDDLKVSFQQVVDKIQQGKAQVASMSMERDVMSIMPNKIIFEVYVND